MTSCSRHRRRKSPTSSSTRGISRLRTCKHLFTEQAILSYPRKRTTDYRSKAPVVSAPASEEAVKKFGNAKAISSDQFFGNGQQMDVGATVVYSRDAHNLSTKRGRTCPASKVSRASAALTCLAMANRARQAATPATPITCRKCPTSRTVCARALLRSRRSCPL